MSGTHDVTDSVLIIKGPHIKHGIRLSGVSIMDITPTLLTWLKIPVARDMDGRVVRELFEEEYIQENPVRQIDTYETSEHPIPDGNEGEMTDRIRKELQGLGYLD
jgi:arylsulfatase A-like enzyme